MTIRTEVESVIEDFAKSRGLKVAYEGCAFTPDNLPYLRVFFMNKAIRAPDLAVQTKTTIGMFQVDVCCLDKRGSAEVEELAQAVADLFPCADKQAFPTITIEGHPQIGRAMIEGNFRIIPVTVEYRQ